MPQVDGWARYWCVGRLQLLKGQARQTSTLGFGTAGRDGDTIKALQTFTGALIQIDQVHDIVRGTFKGFALLRQATGHSNRGPQPLSNKPVYAPGYGLVPPSQLYGGTGDIASAQVPMQPLQPMQMSTTPLPGPVYNVISAPGYSGPVFFSPMEYANLTAAGLGPAGGNGGRPAGGTAAVLAIRAQWSAGGDYTGRGRCGREASDVA
eukprot:XP_001701158.1 predicted protein [Chlamydomonas reinhardtii]